MWGREHWDRHLGQGLAGWARAESTREPAKPGVKVCPKVGPPGSGSRKCKPALGPEETLYLPLPGWTTLAAMLPGPCTQSSTSSCPRSLAPHPPSSNQFLDELKFSFTSSSNPLSTCPEQTHSYQGVMERPLECGDVSPNSQGHVADGKRFAVCGFRNPQKEEEPAHQIQTMDPRPSRSAGGATQDVGLQGDFLAKEPQSLPDQRAADGSGGYQRSILGGPPAQSEEPAFSELENLLCPGSPHLNLTQGDNDHQGGGLIGDPGPDRALPAGCSPLSETPPKLLEAGKGDWEV